MFTPETRERLRERLLELARADERITAGALIGASTPDAGDRWSDLDLGFGVTPAEAVPDVIETLTAVMRDEFKAVHLFDLPHLASIYRVFLVPGALQVDLSFTPADRFGALGPRFKLLFGEAAELSPPASQPAAQVFGLAVHHAVRARICIERGRLWQAEHWISGLRDDALALACRRAGLPSAEGRGFDNLPADVLASAVAALPRAVESAELLRALGGAVDLLLAERAAAPELAKAVGPDLRELLAPGALG